MVVGEQSFSRAKFVVLVCQALVSAIMPSGNDLSVDMVVASKLHHGSDKD